MIFNMIANGGSDWELLAEAHLGELNITDTTAITLSSTLTIPNKTLDIENDCPMWALYVVDNNGARNGYFLGTISLIVFTNGSTTYRTYYSAYSPGYILRIDENGGLVREGQTRANNMNGIYPYSITASTGAVTFRGRYSTSASYASGTIDGDFYAYAYALKAPMNILGE